MLRLEGVVQVLEMKGCGGYAVERGSECTEGKERERESEKGDLGDVRE